jgi:hypothetical protein
MRRSWHLLAKNLLCQQVGTAVEHSEVCGLEDRVRDQLLLERSQSKRGDSYECTENQMVFRYLYHTPFK